MRETTAIPALSFRPFTEQDALTVASWRYPEPWVTGGSKSKDVLMLRHIDHVFNRK